MDEFVDCSKHWRFLYKSANCPACQTEARTRAREEAKAREQRFRHLEGTIWSRASVSVEQSIGVKRGPIVSKLRTLITAAKEQERARPLPPKGLVASLFLRSRFLQAMATHEDRAQQLAGAVARQNSELAVFDSRWTPEAVKEETAREFRKACQHETEYKVLAEEREIRGQRAEERRSLCDAEFKRLRPDFKGSVQVVPRGQTVTGILLGASQMDGRLQGFLDSRKTIYCIPLPSVLVDKIGQRFEYYKAKEDERQTFSIRDYESDDDL